jgi:hypothetical protein
MKKIYILMIAVLIGGIAKGQWVQCTSPSFQVNSLAVKDTNLFLATYDSGVYISQDYGTTWSSRNNGLIFNNISHFAVNDSFIWAVQNNGIWNSYISVTSNDGLSWVSNPFSKTYFLRASEQHLMSIEYSGPNSGLSINVSNLNYSPNYFYFWGEDNQRFIAVCEDVLYVASISTLNGFSIVKWDTVNSEWKSSFINSTIKDLIAIDSKVYAVTIDGIYSQSVNDTNWSLFVSDTTLTGSLIKYGNKLIAATKNGVSYCNLDGTSWNVINSGMQNKKVNSLAINGMYLFASTYDNGIWKLPLSELVGIKENLTINNINLYPNPATNTLSLNLSQLQKLQNASLSIYDIQGKLLLHQNISHAQTQIDISSFAKGIYIVKVQTDKETLQSKFVKE